MILCQSGVLEVPSGMLPDVGVPPAARAIARPAGAATLEDVERAHILDTLEDARWVIEGPRGAARILDLHPNTLRSRMKRLGIQRPVRRTSG